MSVDRTFAEDPSMPGLDPCIGLSLQGCRGAQSVGSSARQSVSSVGRSAGTGLLVAPRRDLLTAQESG
jgi:hypothetical protein